jgi:DNA-binding MarR family transcriptional regulator
VTVIPQPLPAAALVYLKNLRFMKQLETCNLYAPFMSPPANAKRAARDADVVMQASKVISAALAHSLALAGDTVSAPGLRVLVMLDAAGSLNLSAVAEGLGVNASTASRTCDRLVVDGLVDRREQAADRRQVALSLTESGSAFVDRVMSERRDVLMRVLDAMPADERARLVEALTAFVAAAATLGDADGADDGHGEIIRWLV